MEETMDFIIEMSLAFRDGVDLSDTSEIQYFLKEFKIDNFSIINIPGYY